MEIKVGIRGHVRAFCSTKKRFKSNLKDPRVIRLVRELGLSEDIAAAIDPDSVRNDRNMFTNVGCEYLAQLMSIETAGSPGTPFRSDSIAYIGVGSGVQAIDETVTGLVTPIAYDTGEFLAELDIPPTFPLAPSKTKVRYHRNFAEDEITLVAGTINITELGLYTNGEETTFVAGDRDTTLDNASEQSAVAYKAFNPVAKNETHQFEVYWDIEILPYQE